MREPLRAAGKILDLAMAIGMTVIRWLIGQDNGQQRDDTGCQVDHGFHGIGKKADRVRQEKKP